MLGSLIIWGIDRGTPAWTNFHFNGWNGKIYHAFGKDWPQFLVYLLCSFVSTLFVSGIVGIVYAIINSNGNCCAQNDGTEAGVRRRRASYYGTQRRRQSRDQHGDNCCCCDGHGVHHCPHCDCFLCCPFDGGNNNGKACAIIGLIFFMIIIIAGLIFLLMFIVGSIGKAVDRQCEVMRKQVEVKYKRVQNLRPLRSSSLQLQQHE